MLLLLLLLLLLVLLLLLLLLGQEGPCLRHQVPGPYPSNAMSY